MADATPEEEVQFHVTRPRTVVFHPKTRKSGWGPVISHQTQEWTTGDTLSIPVSVADKWVSEEVGEIVKPEPAATATRAPGRPRSE